MGSIGIGIEILIFQVLVLELVLNFCSCQVLVLVLKFGPYQVLVLVLVLENWYCPSDPCLLCVYLCNAQTSWVLPKMFHGLCKAHGFHAVKAIL